jgi:hypothetical protein
MWKNSIDMLPFLAKKESFSIGSIFKSTVKEASQAAIKEASQAAIKEASQAAIKEASQAAIKEASQAAIKEASQAAVKEASQAAVKEASQAAVKSTIAASIKKTLLAGAVIGAAVSSQIKTDTNGDGVIDDKDESLLSQAGKEAGKLAGDVAGAVLPEVADIGGGLLTSILEGLGIDVEEWKKKFGQAMEWVKYFLYFILLLIVVKVLSTIYSGFKSVGIFGRSDLSKF